MTTKAAKTTLATPKAGKAPPSVALISDCVKFNICTPYPWHPHSFLLDGYRIESELAGVVGRQQSQSAIPDVIPGVRAHF